MAEIILDDIDVDAIMDALTARHSLYRNEPRTVERAMQELLGEGLDLSLRNNRPVTIQNDEKWPKNRYISLRTTDTIGREDMIKLMSTSIVHGGTRFWFAALRADGSSSEDSVYANSWHEITFTPREA